MITLPGGPLITLHCTGIVLVLAMLMEVSAHMIPTLLLLGMMLVMAVSLKTRSIAFNPPGCPCYPFISHLSELRPRNYKPSSITYVGVFFSHQKLLLGVSAHEKWQSGLLRCKLIHLMFNVRSLFGLLSRPWTCIDVLTCVLWHHSNEPCSGNTKPFLWLVILPINF